MLIVESAYEIGDRNSKSKNVYLIVFTLSLLDKIVDG